MKRLTRSKNRIIAGVCSGIADYVGVDPAIIRILWVVLTLFTLGIGGIIAYLLCWILIPKK